MKVIIAGGRDFSDYKKLVKKCDLYLSKINEEIIIISGNAKGADILGEKYAKEKGYEVIQFKADWEKHGKSAGYIRNKEMAKNSDCLIAFWDGESKGTKHMIDIAKNDNLKIRIVKYKKND